ncbi:MAG: extracellular matrix regulator RemB [Moorellaceae bacterium]
MYLHVGRDTVVPLREIVAILDYQKFKHSTLNKEFWAVRNRKPPAKEGTVKSFIVTVDNKIYYSNISSTTLAKRAALAANRSVALENVL